MSANAGWYPDPGGGAGLYRYWDGRAWSAATSPFASAPPPVPSLGSAPPAAPSTPSSGTQQPYGQDSAQQPYGQSSAQQPNGQSSGQPDVPGGAYAAFRATSKRKTPVGWWLGAAALLVVIVLIAALVIRGVTGGGLTGNAGGGQASEDACPQVTAESPSPVPDPTDGRVHGGPVSYPRLSAPWGDPETDNRVPFGSDVESQLVTVEPNYEPGQSWVASVLVGELQAGDGFYTPQQGSAIVVKCILGAFYGDNEVDSDVKVDRATTIDGHDGWLVESQLTFDIPNLQTKGELLIVAIVSVGTTAGLYYASIPDTRPDLVAPAREALKNLRVQG